MDTKENRRKHKRHPASWKIALVLNKSDGKPIILHTQTIDLSLGGVAIVSEHGDLKGKVVSVLLAYPPRDGAEKPKIVKARARVVSSAQEPRSGYRLGMNFIQWPEDGPETLAQLLSSMDGGTLQPAPTAPAPATEGFSAGAASRLARLKELAQSKLAEKDRPDAQAEIDERVSEALQRVHQYLKDLVEQLNVVQPGYKGYSIVGVPDFNGLTWQAGRVDFRAREISPIKKLYERVTLIFRLTGKKEIRVALHSPASDKLKQTLTEYKIQFTTELTRNDPRTTFVFPCEVNASALLEGDFQRGQIVLRMSNVERFGMLEHRLSPTAITEQALEEFAGFLMGENHRIDQLLRSG
jgi:hypothetical protein